MTPLGRGLLAACLSLAWAGTVHGLPAGTEAKAPSSTKRYPSAGIFTLENAKVTIDGGTTLVVQPSKGRSVNGWVASAKETLLLLQPVGTSPITVVYMNGVEKTFETYKQLHAELAKAEGTEPWKEKSLEGFTFEGIQFWCTSKPGTPFGHTLSRMVFMLPEGYWPKGQGPDSKASEIVSGRRSYDLWDVKIVKASKDAMRLAPGKASFSHPGLSLQHASNLQSFDLSSTGQGLLKPAIYLFPGKGQDPVKCADYGALAKALGKEGLAGATIPYVTLSGFPGEKGKVEFRAQRFYMEAPKVQEPKS